MSTSFATVLIVDDMPANRLVLERHVQRLGHHTLCAGDGAEALAVLAAESVDLLLLDLMMPVMNGFETLAALKADPALAAIPVVVVSALGDSESVARCVRLGAEDYLFKPIDRVLLEARIESSLARKRLHDREQAARAAADAANQARGAFVSLVSHELKSPISALIGYADLLLASATHEPDPYQREHLETMRRLGVQLTTLLDDLSDLSRIESGHLQLAPGPLSLSDAVEAAVATVEGDLRARRHVLTVTLPGDLPPIWADHMRVVQILTNLLSNACKYTPDGGTIGLRAARRDAVYIEVTVSDSGIGIVADDQERVFAPFFRSSAPAVARQPGKGLGLSIVRHLVELQGGQIWCHSAPGAGSTFGFTLLAALDVSADAPTEREAGALPSRS